MILLNLFRKAGLILLILLILGLVHVHSQNKSHNEPEEGPIVVLVELSQGRVVYGVDSRPVEDIMEGLRIALRQRGEDHPVVILLDVRVPISFVLNTERIASKLGFRDIRSFIFEDKQGFMSQIKIVPGMPFTTNPPTQ